MAIVPLKQTRNPRTAAAAPVVRAVDGAVPTPGGRGPGSELWLALGFPDLALEVLGGTDDAPVAVTTEEGSRRWVHACNDLARDGGVQVGMALNAAYALLADLHVFPRQVENEERLLARLAGWAWQFSPRLVIDGNEGLTLEIGASLRLFGGLDAIWEAVAQGLSGLGHRPVLAVAPTPLAARVAVRAGVSLRITAVEDIPGRLGPLPLAALIDSQRVLDTLEGMGVHRIGELLRLPRAGLGRRFGADRVTDLERLLGRRPDPRRAWQPPPGYAGHMDMAYESVDSARILHVAERLLGEMEGYLRGADAGVTRLRLELRHRDAEPTRVDLGVNRPRRDPRHLSSLLAERLERHTLPEPVSTVVLKALDIESFRPQARDLFGSPAEEAEAGEQLLERLRARLGHDAVNGLCLAPDHRPERAWVPCEPGAHRDLGVQWVRPLWLLDEPRPIAGGPDEYRFIDGPERIETGWWDGHDVARDYFIVQDGRLRRRWIFRDRRTGGWFVQGFFA
ncbi:MAG: Y-family DNA polymerase [Gammaproteobacteria bacterium]